MKKTIVENEKGRWYIYWDKYYFWSFYIED